MKCLVVVILFLISYATIYAAQDPWNIYIQYFNEAKSDNSHDRRSVASLLFQLPDETENQKQLKDKLITQFLEKFNVSLEYIGTELSLLDVITTTQKLLERLPTLKGTDFTQAVKLAQGAYILLLDALYTFELLDEKSDLIDQAQVLRDKLLQEFPDIAIFENELKKDPIIVMQELDTLSYETANFWLSSWWPTALASLVTSLATAASFYLYFKDTLLATAAGAAMLGLQTAQERRKFPIGQREISGILRDQPSRVLSPKKGPKSPFVRGD